MLKIIKLTDVRMKQVLPDNILNSDVLSYDAKKVLASVLNYHFIYSKVTKQGGYLACPNEIMGKSVGLNDYDFKAARRELIDTDLIEVDVDKQYGVNIYRVHWNNLTKPFSRKNYNDMIKEYLDGNN